MSVQSLFATSFRAISLLFLLLCAIAGVRTLIFLRSSTAIYGNVIDYHEVQNYAPFGLFAPEDSARYFVKVQYQPAESEEQYIITATQGRSEKEYELESEIAILYNANRPAQGRINSNQELWGSAVIFGIIALIFGSIGAIVPFAFRLGNQNSQNSSSTT